MWQKSKGRFGLYGKQATQACASLSGGGTGSEVSICVCADVLGEEEDRLWGQRWRLESQALRLTSRLVNSLLCDMGINKENLPHRTVVKFQAYNPYKVLK